MPSAVGMDGSSAVGTAALADAKAEPDRNAVSGGEDGKVTVQEEGRVTVQFKNESGASLKARTFVGCSASLEHVDDDTVVLEISSEDEVVAQYNWCSIVGWSSR